MASASRLLIFFRLFNLRPAGLPAPVADVVLLELASEDGELVETGTHAQLLARGGVYTRLLERQLLEEEIEREEAV